jgi:hypothetical protein
MPMRVFIAFSAALFGLLGGLAARTLSGSASPKTEGLGGAAVAGNSFSEHHAASRSTTKHRTKPRSTTNPLISGANGDGRHRRPLRPRGSHSGHGEHPLQIRGECCGLRRRPGLVSTLGGCY